VGPGDTVAVYGPAITEALVVYLACASIGAVHSSCSIEFGAEAVISRLQQIEPKVLVSADGYRFGDREINRIDQIRAVVAAVTSIETSVIIPYLNGRDEAVPGMMAWEDFIAVRPEPLRFTAVPFDHPLVVVYTSGTTGPPKPIVHSHGGVLLEHLKSLGLQLGVDSSDRFFWYTTVGWMMWNYLVSGLLVGATVILFDGDPGYPDAAALWRMAADEGITVFGASPRFLQLTRRAVGPSFGGADLAALRTVGSTGSPLGVEEYEWFYKATDLDAALVSASGGTDVLSALVCWAPIVPVYAGEISCAALGVDVAVVDAGGQTVVDREGELVIRQPMPSMPIRFWNDPSGERLYSTYFAANPGLWTQGDWATMTSRKTFVLSGRSDATLNRRGIRVGTAELYAVVEELRGVRDSLAVCLEGTGDDDLLIVLVATEPTYTFDHELETRIRFEIKRRLSPRHVPDLVVAVSEIPRNSSGKKAELPVKRLLQSKFGQDPVEESRRFRQSVAAASAEVIEQLRDLRDELVTRRGRRSSVSAGRSDHSDA
jgi:acetoacetyl-CoA synthetase